MLAMSVGGRKKTAATDKSLMILFCSMLIMPRVASRRKLILLDIKFGESGSDVYRPVLSRLQSDFQRPFSSDSRQRAGNRRKGGRTWCAPILHDEPESLRAGFVSAPEKDQGTAEKDISWLGGPGLFCQHHTDVFYVKRLRKEIVHCPIFQESGHNIGFSACHDPNLYKW